MKLIIVDIDIVQESLSYNNRSKNKETFDSIHLAVEDTGFKVNQPSKHVRFWNIGEGNVHHCQDN